MKKDYHVQVKREHYKFDKYLHIRRWGSYYNQIKEVLEHDAKNVLLIGEGDGIVSGILCKLGIHVTTFDFAEDLNPDIVGDVREIENRVEKNFYDCILCCEVLEHLEFKYFEGIIRSFCKVVKKNGIIILSLPQHKVWIKIHVDLVKWQIKQILMIPKFWKWKITFKGEHYWEIGAKGYSKRKILHCLKKECNIEKHYTAFENPYHWFCILQRK